jgi:hypothetical protein
MTELHPNKNQGPLYARLITEAAELRIDNGNGNGSYDLLHAAARVAKYAEERFLEHIDNLLDDPSFLSHPDEDPHAYLRVHRQIATDLGLDFDELIATRGHEVERERLKALLVKLEGGWSP